MDRFWPTGLESTAGLPQGSLQNPAGSSGRAVVSCDPITLTDISKGRNYRITVSLAAHGRFGDARYIVRARCSDSDAVLTEELSAKTDAVVSLMLFIKSACAHSWGYEPLTVSLELEGDGWSGQQTDLTGLEAVVEEIT